MSTKLTIEECRETLGIAGDTMTDAQVEKLRDDLIIAANSLYDELAAKQAKNAEGVRWFAHFAETGEAE